MHNLHGGAIQKNPEKSKIGALFYMLGKAKTLILLSDNSLYGFIIEFTVDEEDSEYIKNNGQPITTFILKIVIITSPTKRELPLYKLNRDHPKQTETRQSFLTETTIQHDVWLKSIRYNYDSEICPDVVDAFELDKTNSINLIRQLQVLNDEDEENEEDKDISYMLTYLTRVFSPLSIDGYGMGIIIMPKVINSLTLRDYGQSYTIDHTIYSNLVAQTVRLLIVNGIIHLDLHTNNILVRLDQNKYCVIIDFGQILKLEPSEYESYRSNYEELNDDAQKSEFMKKSFNYIIECERKARPKIEAHLEWVRRYCLHNPGIYLLSFQTLVVFMSPPQFPLPPPSKKMCKKPKTQSHSDSSNMQEQNSFNPEQVGCIEVPSIPDEIFTAKMQKRTDIQKQKKEKKYKEFELIRQRNMEEQAKRQEKLDEYEANAEAEASIGKKRTNTETLSSKECSDEGVSVCIIAGGKRKTIKRKTTKKKRIQRKNKTYRRKQKQK